jgi:GTP-binding protein HflX
MQQIPIDVTEKRKRAFLVCIQDGDLDPTAQAREFSALAETLAVDVSALEVVKIRERRARYGMGSGKAEELAARAEELGADCLIFDHEISPTQQRNWETLAGIPVLDRQELIIQIFVQRAQTREAVLQVELAELSYALPRLSHKYIDLSRQRGGSYGTRGAGETRLELDRRRLQDRIKRLKDDLGEVRKHRTTQRKRRDQNLMVCALVGYTNAGKSSILNALTGSQVLAENKLFATLDPTVRRLDLPRLDGPPQTILLADTVGFIRKLPHNLVDAFRSTLEEAVHSDLLIHILDAADPQVSAHYETTLGVLRDLEADNTPRLTVFNKIDALPQAAADLRRDYPDAFFVSAQTGAGLSDLKEELERRLGGLAKT